MATLMEVSLPPNLPTKSNQFEDSGPNLTIWAHHGSCCLAPRKDTILKGNVCTKAWTILPLLDEIRRLSAGFSYVEWRWIPRGANRAAHVTAAIELRAVCPQGWANQPPPSLVRVLASDGLPSPP
ncbi:hypothetical protein L3X38_015080 [Prunus dulcis]|uniref:RNase H type-1 domain-containing protein n=1 Tax=Prunus dulcis TaxID=3755 RepID=A0AAD4WQ04_PRUDU|nr:hypothetical protein L3X38_015080 [Prunus dulcis]